MRWLVENAEQGMTQRQIAQAMSSDPNTVASLLENGTFRLDLEKARS